MRSTLTICVSIATLFLLKPVLAEPATRPLDTKVALYVFTSSDVACTGNIDYATLKDEYLQVGKSIDSYTLGIYSYHLSKERGGIFRNDSNQTNGGLQVQPVSSAPSQRLMASLTHLPPNILPEPSDLPWLIVSAAGCSTNGLLTWTLHSYRIPSTQEAGSKEKERDLGSITLRSDKLVGLLVSDKDALQDLFLDSPSAGIPFLQLTGENSDYINARVTGDMVLGATAVKDNGPPSDICTGSASKLTIQGIVTVSSNTASSLRTSVANVATSFKEPQGAGQPFPLYLYYEIPTLALGAIALPHFSSAYVALYDCDTRDQADGFVAREYIVRGEKKHVSFLDNKNTQAQALQDATDDLIARLACLTSAIRHTRQLDPYQLRKTAELSDEQLKLAGECMLSPNHLRYTSADFRDEGHKTVFDIPARPEGIDWLRR